MFKTEFCLILLAAYLFKPFSRHLEGSYSLLSRNFIKLLHERRLRLDRVRHFPETKPSRRRIWRENFCRNLRNNAFIAKITTNYYFLKRLIGCNSQVRARQGVFENIFSVGTCQKQHGARNVLGPPTWRGTFSALHELRNAPCRVKGL